MNETIPKKPIIEDIDWTQVAIDIRRLSRATKQAFRSGLRENTIVLLLWDATKVPKKQIRAVLRALPDLAKMYLEDGEE